MTDHAVVWAQTRGMVEQVIQNSVRFRFHRGGLDEAIKGTVTVPNYSMLEDLIRGWMWHQFEELPSKGLRFSYSGYDERIAQDTWYVLFPSKDAEYPYKVAGMASGIPPETPPECLEDPHGKGKSGSGRS